MFRLHESHKSETVITGIDIYRMENQMSNPKQQFES